MHSLSWTSGKLSGLQTLGTTTIRQTFQEKASSSFVQLGHHSHDKKDQAVFPSSIFCTLCQKQDSLGYGIGLLGGLCVTTRPLKVAKFNQGFSSVQL